MALSSLKAKLFTLDSHDYRYRSDYWRLYEQTAAGKLEQVRDELVRNGENFTPSDFFTRDSSGSSFLYWDKTIRYLPDAIRLLHEAGYDVPIDELAVKKNTDEYTLLQKATSNSLLEKIFEPRIWANRTSLMDALWQKVSNDGKKQINFEKLRTAAEALSGPEFEITQLLHKEQLFAANDKGLAPLDDSRTWKKLDQIISVLATNGEKLTKTDLLCKNRAGKTYFEVGIGSGQQDRLFAIMDANGEKLTPQDVKDNNLGQFFAANNKEFFEAAIGGNVAKVKTAIKMGLIDLEYSPGGDYGTALYETAKGGINDVVDVLLEAGADPTTQKKAWSVLGCTAYNGKKIIVQKILAALEKRFEADPDKLLAALTHKDGQGDTPLKDARHQDNSIVPIIEQAIGRAQLKMVNIENPDVTKVFPDGTTFLNLAVRAGDFALVKRTLEKLEQVYKDQPQKLYDALLQKGSDGRTPEDSARNANKNDIAGAIKELAGNTLVKIGRIEDLWRAADTGDATMVKRFIEGKKVDVNGTYGDNKSTPLWQAAKNGHTEVIDILLTAGANPETFTPSDKLCALAYAGYQGRKAIVEKLIVAIEKKYTEEPEKALAALTFRYKEGDTVSKLIARENRSIATLVDEAVLRIQLKTINRDDPDVTKVYPDGNTFLNIAVRIGDNALVEKALAKLEQVHQGNPAAWRAALVQKGADGRTPEEASPNGGKGFIGSAIKEAVTKAMIAVGRFEDFYEAAKAGDLSLVKRFIAAKTVDINGAYGDNRWPATLIAAKQGHEPVYDALIEAGISPDARSTSSQNLSVLTLAGLNGKPSIAEKNITQLRDRYKDDPVALFKSLTYRDSDGYSPYKAACRGSRATAEKVGEAVLAMLPQVLEWDAKTLKETEAYRVFGEHGKLGELFKPERWKGKLAELEVAWKSVPHDYSDQIKYDDVFSQTYLLTYPIEGITGKAQILPRSGQEQSALEFKLTWQRIEQVVQQLEKHEERLAKEDLLQKASDGKTLLHKAIEFGATDKVFEIIAASGDRLTKAELMDRNGGADKSNLDLIAEQGKLALVFTPENWAGNVREMQECWYSLGDKHKKQMDGLEGRPSYRAIWREANKASLKTLQAF